MINKSSLTITLASNKYGYGHFKRMFNFKTKLASHNIKNYITHFDNYNLFLNKKKISINYLSNFILEKNIQLLILDLSNSKFLKNKIFLKLINFISNQNLSVIIFDDFTKEIHENLRFFPKNIVICPYVYEDKFLKIKKKKYKSLLVGTKYSILPQHKKIRNRNNKLKKILISCGGTDFKNLTVKLIKILKVYDYLKIFVIVGPHFKKKEKDKIYNFKQKNLKIYYNAENINKIAEKCDFAIITSGLTKYELLSIGMRFAVISENKEFYKFHYPFSKRKFCYDLGYYQSFNILKKRIKKLIDKYDNLEELTNQKDIDTKGAERIIKIIKQKFLKK